MPPAPTPAPRSCPQNRPVLCPNTDQACCCEVSEDCPRAGVCPIGGNCIALAPTPPTPPIPPPPTPRPYQCQKQPKICCCDTSGDCPVHGEACPIGGNCIESGT
jgi:hypothetical protein